MAFTTLMVCIPLSAFGQSPDEPSAALEVFKRVVFDPTTYVPAIVSAEAQHLDWKSSQVFFEQGFLERNPAYTISGRPDDLPISYETGRARIGRAAFVSLGTSVVNNLTMAVVERALIKRYPEHRKLLRGLGWTERIAFASWLTYQKSALHFQQWQRNTTLERQLGY